MLDRIYYQRLDELKERLRGQVSWFPFPALISFVLALLFIGHLLVNINPRLGNPAVILKMDSPLEKEGSLWLSITEKDERIYVTTFDRKVFFWPANTQDVKPLSAFKTYLKATSTELSAQAAVSKYISKSQTRVVMAVDQRIRYFHIRPILHILAEVGLDSYAFETLVTGEIARNTNQVKNGNAKEEI